MIVSDYETYLEQERDRTERIHEQIMELITETESPRDKAMLLLLDQMHASLRTNTSVTIRLAKTTEEHISNFRKHEVREEKVINRTKGALWVLAGVLTIVQVSAVVMVNRALDRDEAIEARLDKLEQKVSGLESHH